MSRLRFLGSALTVLTLVGLYRVSTSRHSALGSELLENPTFERGAEGWLLRGAVPDADLRHGASASVRLDGVEPGSESWSHAGFAISPVPVDRELRFECFVQGHDDGQEATVNAFGYDNGLGLTFRASTSFDLAAGKWTKLTQEYVVPPGTARLTAWIINSDVKPISVSDAHLRVGGPKKAAPRISRKSKNEAAVVTRSAPLALLRRLSANEK
jgi:hypothetical protein